MMSSNVRQLSGSHLPTDPNNQNDKLPLFDSTPASRFVPPAVSHNAIVGVEDAARSVADGRSDSADKTARTQSSDIDSSRELESSFWLQRKDQATVAILAVLLLMGLAAKWFLAGLTDQPAIVEHSADYRVNLNTASLIEISQLKGIGPALAKRIVESRAESGPFRSVEDLQRVSGIGAKKLEANKAWIIVGPLE